MKIKLDENLPESIAEIFEAAAHEVDTVVAEGLAGATDQVVLETAASEGRMLVTLDRGFGTLVPRQGRHSGLMVLRLKQQGVASIRRAIIRFLNSNDIEEFKDQMVIVESDRVRIRAV